MERNDPKQTDSLYEGRGDNFMDIDRMVNEGLGGGQVTLQNGLIEETTTDTMNGKDTDTAGHDPKAD